MRRASAICDSTLSLLPKSYVYSVKPVETEQLVTISSDNSLRWVDKSRLQLVATAQDVHDGVTCLATAASGTPPVFTAGRDGQIRGFDRSSREAVLEIKDAKSIPFLSLAICADSKLVAAGSELAYSAATIQIWDCRAPQKPLVRYEESHNDDVSELVFHPSLPSYIASGSMDGLVNLIDTRLNEDDALLHVINHGSSIHHVGYLGESMIYALSHDETLSLYPCDTSRELHTEPGKPVIFGNVRPILGCEYIVDLFSIEHATPVIAAGNHSERRLDLIPLATDLPWKVDEACVTRFEGAHGEDIVRSIHIDQGRIAFTGGEDGYVRAWRVHESSAGPSRIGPERHKSRKDTGENILHKPY